MAHRISDEVGLRVMKAIDGLEVLDAIREQIRWEVIPVLMPDTRVRGEYGLSYMVCIGLPVPASGDFVLRFSQIEDDEFIPSTVAALYADAQKALDEDAGITPGGLLTR